MMRREPNSTKIRDRRIINSDFNIVLVKEFARAFSNALGCNLHIEIG